MPATHLVLGPFDEIGPEPVAHAARPGVQHHPHVARFVEAQLDEVVARAQRAQVAEAARVRRLGVFLHHGVIARLQIDPARHGRGRRFGGPGALVVAPAIVCPTVRNGGLDGGADRRQVVGQVFDAISELPDAERQAFIAWIVENAHQGADAVKEARRNGASIASAYAMADYGIKLVTAWKSPIVI